MLRFGLIPGLLLVASLGSLRAATPTPKTCPRQCETTQRICRHAAKGERVRAVAVCAHELRAALGACEGTDRPCIAAARSVARACRADAGTAFEHASAACGTTGDACRTSCLDGGTPADCVVATTTTTLTTPMSVITSTTAITPPPLSVDALIQHLNEVMDANRQTYDVLTDLGAPGDHFPARCLFGSQNDVRGITFDECNTVGCACGNTCMQVVFTPRSPHYFAGMYFQAGRLVGDAILPTCAWGKFPGRGADLTGATRLRVKARTDSGSADVELFLGGVGRPPDGSRRRSKFRDSTPRVPPLGTRFHVTPTWREFVIPLDGVNLSDIDGGFGLAASAQYNRHGFILYLDDIRYDLERPDSPRFLPSFVTVPAPPREETFDTLFRNVAYTYDNAVATLAYLAHGTPDSLRRASRIAEALTYAVTHDRYWTDGRVRTAYKAGDLTVPDRWTPNGRVGSVPLPGWWSCDQRRWLEDKDQVGSRTGDVAWAALALLEAHRVLGRPEFLTAAMTLATWIDTNARSEDGPGGYTGGFQGWEPTPTKLPWKGTEHNLDAYVVFMRLYDVTGDPVWRERALHAKGFVLAMWGLCGPGRFATGTKDASECNCDAIPEDAQSWTLMAIGRPDLYAAGIDWVMTHVLLKDPSCLSGAPATGVGFSDHADGPWWEGTAHTVVALSMLGRTAEAAELLTTLGHVVLEAPRADGQGLVMACHDRVATGFDFTLFNRLHIGATAWGVLAALHRNPFWGIAADQPVPHEDDLPPSGSTAICGSMSTTTTRPPPS